MNDDFSNDILTQGIISVDGTPTLGVLEIESDEDWFRANMERFYSYRFEVTSTSTTPLFFKIGIFDFAGTQLFDQRIINVAPRYTADYSGLHFVGVVTGFGGAGGYRVTAQVVDDYGDLESPPSSSLRQLNSGAIEVAGDVDVFDFKLAGGVYYSINVYGVGFSGLTLSDPHLGLYDSSSNVLSVDNDSGDGKNARLIFKPTENSTVRIAVSGNANATGSWITILNAVDDFAADASTTSEVEIGSSTLTRGALEFRDDVDWHKVTLHAGDWYRVRTSGNPSGVYLSDRDSNVVVANQGRLGGLTFQAEESGEFYVVVSQGPNVIGSAVGYDLKVDQFTPRLTTDLYGQFFRVSPGSLHHHVRLNLPKTFDLPEDRFQVYSNIRLKSSLRTIEAGNLAGMSRAEFEQLHIPFRFTDEAQIWVRIARPNSFPWTNWSSIPVIGVKTQGDLGGLPLPREIPFSFAKTLPGYYSGDGTVLEGEFSEVEKNIVRKALGYWDEALGVDFVEREADSGLLSRQMVILKADVPGGHVQGYSPGSGIGYDLKINPFSELMQSAWGEGRRPFYEILRGIGRSLGLNSTTSLDRTESLMGLRSTPKTRNLPFPSRPLPIDSFAVNKSAAQFVHDTNDGNTQYRFRGNPFIRTIVDSDGIDTINASGLLMKTHIDLNQGAKSYAGNESSSPYTFVNSYEPFSQRAGLENAIGGNRNDTLIGNLSDNLLVGNNGDDYLVGKHGTDRLRGGRGNDTYFFELGHGSDFIFEQALGGFDRIIVEGLPNFDSLTDDLLFRRLGNDLEIRLDLDRLGDEKADTITIRGMGSRFSRVERLDLRNVSFDQTGNWLAQLSLKSAFDQSDGIFRRMTLVSGSDGFGQLVSRA